MAADPASPARRASARRWLVALLLAALAVAGGWAAVRRAVPARPDPWLRAGAMPSLASGVGERWFWVERSKGAPQRLVVAQGREARAIAEADAVTTYHADGQRVAWIERSGKQWRVCVSELGAVGRRVLWQGPEEPWGARLVWPGVCWLRRTPAEAPGLRAHPPLGPQLEVVGASLSGGPVVSVGTLPEEGPGEVLGEHGASLVVAAWRTGAPGNTVFYLVPVGGAPVRRLAGEVGIQHGVLERDGALVWPAPSREATVEAAASCIRRLPARGGGIETIAEWLPARGALFVTQRGLIYVGGEWRSEAWLPGAPTELPRPAPRHRDVAVVAAGERDLLLVSVTAAAAKPMLYRAPLP